MTNRCVLDGFLQLTNLRELSIQLIAPLSPSGWRTLTGLPALQSLDLQCLPVYHDLYPIGDFTWGGNRCMTTLYTTHLYKASLEGICALPLTHLRFHFANQSNGQIYNWVGAADVETLSEVLHAQRDTLRSVSISGVEMTMPIVTALTSLPRLDTL